MRLSNGGRAVVSPLNLHVIVASLFPVACSFNVATKKRQNIIVGKGLQRLPQRVPKSICGSHKCQSS